MTTWEMRWWSVLSAILNNQAVMTSHCVVWCAGAWFMCSDKSESEKLDRVWNIIRTIYDVARERSRRNRCEG